MISEFFSDTFYSWVLRDNQFFENRLATYEEKDIWNCANDMSQLVGFELTKHIK